jgi:hypothetical protein
MAGNSVVVKERHNNVEATVAAAPDGAQPFPVGGATDP